MPPQKAPTQKLRKRPGAYSRHNDIREIHIGIVMINFFDERGNERVVTNKEVPVYEISKVVQQFRIIFQNKV